MNSAKYKLEDRNLTALFCPSSPPNEKTHPNKIGVEWEVLPLSEIGERLPYSGCKASTEGILNELLSLNWSVSHQESIMQLERQGDLITLEPAGQIELSIHPCNSILCVETRISLFLKDLKTISDNLPVKFYAVGYDPTGSQPFMIPKERYQIMKRHFTEIGGIGKEMMLRTCSAQFTIDYGESQKFTQRLQLATGLQTILTVLTANSSWVAKKNSPHTCHRNFIWQQTDANRCGLLPFITQKEVNFEDYVEYLLKAPMLFIVREGKFLDYRNRSFLSFLNNEYEHSPTWSDWELHATSIFPEIRFKNFFELRGMDSNQPQMIIAVAALYYVVFYYPKAFQAIYDFLQLPASLPHLEQLYQQTPQAPASTLLMGQPLPIYLKEILRLIEKNVPAEKEPNISKHLHFLLRYAEEGKSPAEQSAYLGWSEALKFWEITDPPHQKKYDNKR